MFEGSPGGNLLILLEIDHRLHCGRDFGQAEKPKNRAGAVFYKPNPIRPPWSRSLLERRCCEGNPAGEAQQVEIGEAEKVQGLDLLQLPRGAPGFIENTVVDQGGNPVERDPKP